MGWGGGGRGCSSRKNKHYIPSGAVVVVSVSICSICSCDRKQVKFQISDLPVSHVLYCNCCHASVLQFCFCFFLSTGAHNECVVCMDSERDSLLVPCHHLCVCTTCANTLKTDHGLCPVCRLNITGVIRVYQP